jgi:hemolysin III
MIEALNTYRKKEEIVNVISHGIGAILSIPAFILLILKALEINSNIALFSYIVYGISLMILYFSSTMYHAIQKPSIRNVLNVWDHISIYLLIAGTYTPFALIGLPGVWGYSILSIVWAFGIIGIIIKVFFFGKYNTLSAIAYVIMGWIAVVAINQLFVNVGTTGTLWLFGGGIAYTIGAVIFLFDNKIPYNHAIFHVLVLIGSLCHFISVYFYLSNV